MNIILIIIGLVIILWVRSKIMTKIDKDEAAALANPGRANFIRDYFGDVVHYFEILPNSSIQFEREDQIRINVFGNNEYFAINSYSGGLLIAHIKWSAVQKEWKFERNENSRHIIYTISTYLNQI